MSVALLVGLGACGWLLLAERPLASAERAFRNGQWQEVAAEARKLLSAHPDRSDALLLLARAEARLGRDQVARNLYKKLDPSGLQADDYYLVGRGLIAEGDIDGGRIGLERAIELEPRHSETLVELIRINRRTDRLAEACEHAERLAATPGWEPRGLVLLGQVRQSQTNPEAAANAFHLALTRDPALAGIIEGSAREVRKWLVRCLLQIGKPNEAMAELDAILTTRPLDAEESWLQSRVALQSHDLAAAGDALARGAGYGSLHPEAFEPAPYVGISRCQECHTRIFRAQRSSRHAQTFRTRGDLIDLPLPDRPLPDPAGAPVTHSISAHDGEVSFHTHTPEGDMQAIVEFVMGSGDRAMTLVGRDQAGRWHELRMTYYASISAWDRTPGQKAVPQTRHGFLGSPQDSDALRRCLGCHTTGARVTPDGTGIAAPLGRGFACERCHGPAGNHLIAVDSKFADPAIGRPRLASHAGVNAICGQCHSGKGRGVSEDSPNLARFQIDGLAVSRCSTTDRETLSCLACHSPHHNAEKSPVFYEAKCLECHAEGPGSRATTTRPAHASEIASSRLLRIACPVNPAHDCLSCHMPKVQTDVPNTTFTDHHIRVNSPRDQAIRPSSDRIRRSGPSSPGRGTAR
jgi:tetratricopeptide (TPR) repeat protein